MARPKSRGEEYKLRSLLEYDKLLNELQELQRMGPSHAHHTLQLGFLYRPDVVNEIMEKEYELYGKKRY